MRVINKIGSYYRGKTLIPRMRSMVGYEMSLPTRFLRYYHVLQRNLIIIFSLYI